MPFECPLHFAFVAVIRSDEIRANKQEDDIRRVDVAIDGCSKLLAGDNATIMPGVDQALPAETPKMDLQLVAKTFIHMGV
jgi:hypothetical protein